MLVQIAIGDAYGAGLEYIKPERVASLNTLDQYVKHPTHGLRAGQYTDDTQMSIAIAEMLLQDDFRWDLSNVAQRFCEVFARDRRKGYSRNFQKLLEDVVRSPEENWGKELLRRIDEHGRTLKNGAAMRAMPLGLLPKLSDAIERARIQGLVTHEGSAISAAVASASATHYVTYEVGELRDLNSWLSDLFSEDRYISEAFADPWPSDRPVHTKKTKHLGLSTVRAAVSAVVTSSSLSEVLRKSVAYTGDVDTVAAIAMGIAANSDLEKDISSQLYWGLEDGPYGRRYLEQLDTQLNETFRKQ